VTSQPRRSPRAPRFAIPIAILYRTPSDATWLEGWTENISKSGVLFRADRKIELNTPVEMMMEIPTFIATPVAGPAICRGRIVRAVAPSPLEDRPAFAATILEYELARPADPRRI
jgi:PilZ domain-containing protein